MGLLGAVCITIIIVAIIKSGKRRRTGLYGLLAAALTLVAMFALILLFHLNGEIMGHVTAPVVLVMLAILMWTHAKTTTPEAKSEDQPDKDTATGVQ